MNKYYMKLVGVYLVDEQLVSIGATKGSLRILPVSVHHGSDERVDA